MDWKCIDKGVQGNVRYKVLEGMFQSPCSPTVYDALPPVSRMGRVQLLTPEEPKGEIPCVLHLPGTGDHGFKRRLHIGHDLLQHVRGTVCHLLG